MVRDWLRKYRRTLVMGALMAACMAGLTASPAAARAHHRLAPLGVHRQLAGAEAAAWARRALWYLHAPRTAANVRTMRAWFANEGVPHAFNDPLNLITREPGSWTSTVTDPAAVGVQGYRRPHDFMLAFAAEMTRGGPDAGGDYHWLVAGLRSGRGLEHGRLAGLRRDLREYSGGGYDSIPAAYCPC